jgi:hypothetical protein
LGADQRTFCGSWGGDRALSPDLGKHRGWSFTIRSNASACGIFSSYTYGAAELQSHLFACQLLNVLRVQELPQFLLSLLSGVSWDSLLVEEGLPGQKGLALNTYWYIIWTKDDWWAILTIDLMIIFVSSTVLATVLL